MTKPLSKAAQKAVDAEMLATKIGAAMKEAGQAASDAFDAFAKTAIRNSHGRIQDMCGGAFVFAVVPSYAFRKAMLAAGAMERGFDGRWPIGEFGNVTAPEQSAIAALLACEAACAVLALHFPNETIYTDSYYN